ncbi:MAG: hypothetical protein M3008_04825, partial [Chloroflexota bacterium]|nr:hypothetical protein [Chloroflexota bacterium]
MSALATVARSITPEQATAFLGREPVATIELLTALRYDREIQCVGAFVDGALAGVLVVGREDDGALAARFEATESGALLSLIAACPPVVQRIPVHRPWMLSALTSAFRLIPEQPRETVFAATHIALPLSPTVRLVRVADAPI